ncbi:hypothetical protein AB0I55_30355 [Actinocatenispora sera]|uniref:hypothetical protein n=1 Tax=Actinocatenispora sera TaxID=390989 RepID=UPI0033C26A0B
MRIRRRPEWSLFIILRRLAILGALIAAGALAAILLGSQSEPVFYTGGAGVFLMIVSVISFGTVVVGVINPTTNSVDSVNNMADLSVQTDFFAALFEGVPSLSKWRSFDPDAPRS